MTVEPPVADRRPVTRIHHGDEVVDDYEWLRDKDDPDVIAYLEAENAYTDAQTAHLETLRGEIFEEIRSRTKETDLSVPVREGGWWYYTRTVEGAQYGIHCRAPLSSEDDWTPPSIADGSGLPGEQVLLDDNVEAEGAEFYSLGSFDVSPDGTRLVWAADTVGDERYTLRIRDLETGQDLPDTVPGTFAGAVFSPEGDAVYYPTVDDAWRPDTIWRHAVGTSGEDDELVFTEPDERYWVGVGVTRSKRYVEIVVGSKITSEVRLLDTRNPDAGFQVVWPREIGVEYTVEHAVVGGHDRLLVLHNRGAVDFELLEVDPERPADPAHQRVVLAHQPGRRLEEVSAFARFLTVDYRREGLTRIAVLPLPALAESIDSGALLELTFDEELFSVGTSSNPEWEQPTVRYGYTSFVTPPSVFDYDVTTGVSTLLKQQPVLGDFDPQAYEQSRMWATAADGVSVPVSVVARKGVLGAGPAPLVLYGYGSYEASIDPSFSVARLSLLDRGVAFAIAHVRGGGEMGREWYEHGKTLTKRTTFTDFVSVAEHLVDVGVTASDRLVAQGGSAGGLLMGAVANLAPELFAGILAQVPFVDALTSILDPSLPLTVIEWDEWGDPLHDPEVYAYMKSYTPYENVADLPYPRILATTSLNDTRVLYVEPAKWTARLRTVGAPVLLKTEMSAGHGGVSGRYERWREVAFEYAWMLDVVLPSA
ncbi:protease [Cnuibacter physcomitrellae]|uniref:Oligopeptidase B n=1 Tax=Cnuibacter physcomitrellae TaxID=1619308 RepID=A0A1X9LNN2_9MICO|nr:S9 family peptidase [Cnuibacter physcomitrellae]ARJ05561.1 oligopeptidase B [Cnuibacter physcomitrellae]GGI35964.1 protease [Cnuibacter physcomitrellae]